jgi:iron complex outermembrane recepter protein
MISQQNRFMVLAFSSLLGVTVSAQTPIPDLGDAELENLIKMKVTSVSRKEKSLSQTPAAIFVITRDDIRRSGLSSIPELLRMVPGLDVARIDSNKWAITSRGFNERFADKMLVMIDGRSVLTPLSSGVYWDVQDTVIEDIERIEVVRGPGATLWGANAVNGVINIITRKAKDTQGLLVSAGAGSEQQGSSAIRYGGEFGRSGFYRIFAKSDNTQSSSSRADDSFKMLRGGFRADWNLSTHDAFTVQGDLYSGDADQSTEGFISPSVLSWGTFNNRSALIGGNILGRWQHTSSACFDTTVQMYAEYDGRDQTGVLSDHRRTVDFELVQHFSARHGNELTWGGDYRHDADDTVGSLNISFNPANRGTNLVGAFLQDEFTVVPERLWLTVGSKLEHNSYSGFALQPNVRMLWAARPTQSFWAAISHAAENSSRFDADIRTNDEPTVNRYGITTLTAALGTHSLPPESVLAYELGYRAQVTERLTFDAAAFLNYYSDRHTKEPGIPFTEGDGSSYRLVLPTVTRSNISGETHGLELSATAAVAKSWKLTAGYTLFETHLRPSAGSQDFDTARESESSSPRHEVQIRSLLNLSRNFQFDTALYYVGGLPGPDIPQYARLDARLGWHLSKRVEVSAGGQNLLDRRHFEFGSGDLVNAAQIGRNFYGRIVWRY